MAVLPSACYRAGLTAAPCPVPSGRRHAARRQAAGRGTRPAERAKNGRNGTQAHAQAKAENGEDEARQRALERVLDEIDGTFGKGTIMRLGDATKAKVATFPSGALTLDAALGGGYPKGRIVEVYGPESAGKYVVCRSGGHHARTKAPHNSPTHTRINLRP